MLPYAHLPGTADMMQHQGCCVLLAWCPRPKLTVVCCVEDSVRMQLVLMQLLYCSVPFSCRLQCRRHAVLLMLTLRQVLC